MIQKLEATSWGRHTGATGIGAIWHKLKVRDQGSSEDGSELGVNELFDVEQLEDDGTGLRVWTDVAKGAGNSKRTTFLRTSSHLEKKSTKR